MQTKLFLNLILGLLLVLAACSDPLIGTATLTPVGPLPYDAGNVPSPDVVQGIDTVSIDSQTPDTLLPDGAPVDVPTLPDGGPLPDVPGDDLPPLWDGAQFDAIDVDIVPPDGWVFDTIQPDVQVVDSGPDALPDAPDAVPDTQADALPDAQADALPDGGPEPDLGPDPGPQTDVELDVEPDATDTDTAPDAAIDAAPDAIIDVSPDVAPDIAPDVAPDVAVDVPPITCSSGNSCPSGLICVDSPSGMICKKLCEVNGPQAETCNGQDDDCNGQTDESGCDDANSCTFDVCKIQLGGCTHLAQPGLPCDADGSACTLDTCGNSGCSAGPAKLCNDGKPCTFDLCNPASGACASTVQSGAPCDDGNGCTGPDFCQGEVCSPGPAKLCNDGNACTLDSCNAVIGQCQSTAMPVGMPCEDGTACTQGDVCQAGVCTGKAISCDDKNPCTGDSCAPLAGCQYVPVDGAACDDGLACTTGETCSGGGCKNGGILGCSDGNPCTKDSCSNLGGCQHILGSGACDDGTACTQGESCKTGLCAGGVSLNCDDQNACTDDSCSQTAGCQHAPHVGACNDGNPCTIGDFCQGGSCVGGAANTCDDGIGCTADSCDPSTGGCQHNGNAGLCDDGIACTKDSCTPGGCAHDSIANCCGGKNCGTGEVCIVYPDTLVPFCAKPCNTGADCPSSCCHMSFATKHCITDTYKAECCGTTEYWGTDASPYKCGPGGTGECTTYPNPKQPYYPSLITHCDTPCTKNSECPGACCGSTTMGTQLCIWAKQPYTSMFCPNM